MSAPIVYNPFTNNLDYSGIGSGGVVDSITATLPLVAGSPTGDVALSINEATTTNLGSASFNSSNFEVSAGAVSSKNIDIIAGTGLSGGGNVTLGGSVTLNATGSSTDYHVARYIVSAGGSADGANYTTIASAYAAAVTAGAPQTVFVQPGTYTENITLSAGINISAFDCDALTPNVTISGKITAAYTGSASISGINLQTNSDFAVVLSGSNAAVLFLTDCYITALNNTALSITNSNSAARFWLHYCQGNISTTGITFFTYSGVCSFKMFYSIVQNTGSSTTASTISGTSSEIDHCNINFPITTSSIGGLTATNSSFNETGLIFNGSGTTELFFVDVFDTGTSSITIGASGTLYAVDLIIDCNVTNAIAGSGTLNCTPISFIGSSSTIQNTLTVNSLPFLPSSGGGVTGPISSTNTGIATWNGTGGNTLNSPPSPLVSSLGIQTNPNQPCFLAYLSASQSAVTGDGTVYQVPFDTIVYDQGSNFTTGASAHFTAPVTGKYLFTTNVLSSLGAVATIQSIQVDLVATSRTTRSETDQAVGGGNSPFSNTAILDMTTGDTLHVNFTVNNFTAKNVAVDGSASPYFTWISGYLVA